MRRVSVLGGTLACALLAAACSGNSSHISDTSTTTAKGAGAAGGEGVITSRTLEAGGLTRSYHLLVPSSLDASKPAAIVVVLHGGFGQGSGAIRQGNWNRAAEQHGFMVVAPDGVSRSWNAGICCGPAMRRGIDDVAFVRSVLDDVARTHRVDTTRVYASGISNGGMMSYRLACEAADRFAAIAPVASTLSITGCAPSRPVSLLHIHGLADGNVPFDGGRPTKALQANPPSYPPVRAGIDLFVRANRCVGQSVVTLGVSYNTTGWPSCASSSAVELITIPGGGHSWPGGNRMAAILDPPSPALDATATIWQFFADHPRPS